MGSEQTWLELVTLDVQMRYLAERQAYLFVPYTAVYEDYVHVEYEACADKVKVFRFHYEPASTIVE